MHIKDFEEHLTSNTRLKINLNYKNIMKTEKNLGALLSNLFEFH